MPSQLQVQWKESIKSRKVLYNPSLHNKSSIAPKAGGKIMAAVVAIWPILSNIFNQTRFKKTAPIHTEEITAIVPKTPLRELLELLAIRYFHKTTMPSWTLSQFNQFPPLLTAMLYLSSTTLVLSLLLQLVEIHWTTLFWSLDMVVRTICPIGSLRTHGELVGVKVGLLESKENMAATVPVSVLSRNFAQLLTFWRNLVNWFTSIVMV